MSGGKYFYKYTVGFILTLMIYFAFQFLYFNRFLPIQEGWFVEYAKQVQLGKVIYKDFHVFTPPIYPFIFSWISDQFGYSVIVFRYYGLVERSLLVATIYLIFTQVVSPYRATMLSLIGLFIYTSNTNDVIYSYYQLVAVFAFASAYSLILYYKNGNNLAVILAGMFSGLAFLTKQSTGVLVPTALLLMMVAIGFSRVLPGKKTLASLLQFIAGLLIPIASVLAYLLYLNALGAYWDQVFRGAASKGGLLHILFGFWGHMLGPEQMFLIGVFFLFIYAISVKSERITMMVPRLSRWIDEMKVSWLIFGIMLSVCVLNTPLLMKHPDLYSKVNAIYIEYSFFHYKLKLVFVVVFFTAGLVCYYFYKAIVKTITAQEVPIAIISVCSFAFMYSHGFSGLIEPHAAVIGAGLLFGWLLEIPLPLNQLKKALVYSLMIVIVGLAGFEKLSRMYSWWGWDEGNVWEAKFEPETPLLKGFFLNRNKVEILDGVTKAIRQYSGEADAIYTFPHMPLFYLLADRKHDTFSAVHYFDVCSDALAISDAKIIRMIKPKVIVIMYFPESAWKQHEDIFRGGRRSGQRDIMELVDRFKHNGEYKSVLRYSASGYNYEIEVLAKNLLVGEI